MLGTVFWGAALISAARPFDNSVLITDIDNAWPESAERWFNPIYPFTPSEVMHIKNMVFGSFIDAYLTGVYEDSAVTAIKKYDWSNMGVARKLVDEFFFRRDEPAAVLLEHFENDPTAKLALYKFYTRTRNELQGAPGARFDAFKQKLAQFPQEIKGLDYTLYAGAKQLDILARRTILCVKFNWGKVNSAPAPELDALWAKLLSPVLGDLNRFVLIQDLAVMLCIMSACDWLYHNGVLRVLLQLAADLGRLHEVTFFIGAGLKLDEKFCGHFARELASIHYASGDPWAATNRTADRRLKVYNILLTGFCFKHRLQLLSQADTIAPALHHHYNPGSARYRSLGDIMRSAPTVTFKDMPQLLVYLLYFFKSWPFQNRDKDLLVRFCERLESTTVAIVLCYVGMEFNPNHAPVSVLADFVESMDAASKKSLLQTMRQGVPHGFQNLSDSPLTQRMRTVLASLLDILEKSHR